MFCHKCGAQVDDQATFCDKCGTALQNTLPLASTIRTTRPETSGSPTVGVPETGASRAFPVPVEYAGFWKRFAAALIDGLLMGAAYICSAFAIGFVFAAIAGPEAEEMSDATANAIAWIAWAGTMVLGWLYYALMESSAKQATLGKMALGIVVTDEEGHRVSFGRATGRYFSKIISGIILYIGYIMIAFTAKKQGLHDIITDCLVVVKGRGNPSL
ncbi:MAG: RDD family protein [Dehalococcoidia bacterium]|nr:RDD family protein [Dehalococcoidia bacterium]